MILIEEYESDFEKGDLKLNLKPKYTLHYYEGKYQDVEFEVVDGDGIYLTINWIDDNGKFESILDVEEKIIKEFIENL